VVGPIQILLGLGIWTGSVDGLIPLHIALGLLISVLLLAAAWIGGRAGASAGRVALAVLWVPFMVAFGLAQAKLLPGAAHGVVQILHLAVGLVALAQVEVLVRAAIDEARGPRAVRTTG
jgi:hypothetical protein